MNVYLCYSKFMIIEKKPTWVKHLKGWGMRSGQLASKLECPEHIVVKAYNGDEKAFHSLLDGTASKSGKKILHPSVSPFIEVSKDKRHRPNGMSKEQHRYITKGIYEGCENFTYLRGRTDSGKCFMIKEPTTLEEKKSLYELVHDLKN
jgi:hypothetical protein